TRTEAPSGGAPVVIERHGITLVLRPRSDNRSAARARARRSQTEHERRPSAQNGPEGLGHDPSQVGERSPRGEHGIEAVSYARAHAGVAIGRSSTASQITFGRE